ncbi:class I SAM-dependent methyltransferase [Verrucomicrobiales bacterium BCK34]|nr:class I SAM-dependent methyltransferase [Verrucomicrobiales bacterium BCK34]
MRDEISINTDSFENPTEPSIPSLIGLPVYWIKKNSEAELNRHFVGNTILPPVSPYVEIIERAAAETNMSGALPLWRGYTGHNASGLTRQPNDVRIASAMGNLFAHLVSEIQPNRIVEFGTAFGISGMYFLAGLEENNKGKLLTFEPNEIWAAIAKENLSSISSRFEAIVGTFEEKIDNALGIDEKIDLAFIDAIHTKEFVLPQLDMVTSRARSGSVIILDDINFNKDMRECWEAVSADDRFSASLKVGSRVGIVEVR